MERFSQNLYYAVKGKTIKTIKTIIEDISYLRTSKANYYEQKHEVSALDYYVSMIVKVILLKGFTDNSNDKFKADKVKL